MKGIYMNVIKQTFTVGNSPYFIEGHYVLYKDSTLMYSNPLIGNFELLLGEGYHVSLGIDRETGECLTFYTLLYAITFEKTSLYIPDAKRTALFYQSDLLKIQEGGHYAPFLEKMYYDPEKMILAFGNIKSTGTLIEFSENTYAMLNNDQLDAIYIRVAQDAIDRIKKHDKKRRFWHF